MVWGFVLFCLFVFLPKRRPLPLSRGVDLSGRFCRLASPGPWSALRVIPALSEEALVTSQQWTGARCLITD